MATTNPNNEEPASIEYRLEQCFAGELTTRLAGGAPVYVCRDVEKEVPPPYVAVQADEAKETFPGAGVYYVLVSILVGSLMDETSGKAHAQKVQAVRMALESIPSGVDDEFGVRIFGFVVKDSTPVNEGQELGDIFELRVGCGLVEKGTGEVLNLTPKTEAAESL